MHPSIPRTAPAVASLWLLTLTAGAQCELQWQPGGGLAGVSGTVHAVCSWDPDGAGPLPELVVAGGAFVVAGSSTVHHIATWDRVTDEWSDLAGGTNGVVRSLLVTSANELLVGGAFTTAGGAPANGVARWDGLAWTALGTGVTQGAHTVCATAQLLTGELIAAGSFPSGLGTNSTVGRWNGSTWQTIGTMDGSVRCFEVLPGGGLLAGGSFQHINGAPARGVAKWDGVAWSQLLDGVAGEVRALRVGPLGRVWIGGTAVPYVHAYVPGAWVYLPSSTNRAVDSIEFLANGNMVIGGEFGGAGQGAGPYLAQWNGSLWVDLGRDLDATVHDIEVLANGEVLIGGEFDYASDGLTNKRVSHVALLSGTSWRALGTGIDNSALCALALPDGDTIVGGSFRTIGGIQANRIARWDGSAFHPLGSGLDGTVKALALLPNGDIVAGGSFLAAGGIPSINVARWNGTSWLSMPGLTSSSSQSVRTLAVRANGELFAGGDFSQPRAIARWTGSTWVAAGNPTTTVFSALITSLLPLPNGDLVAGGFFEAIGGVATPNVALWNGVSWSAIGAGLPLSSIPFALARQNGDFVVSTFQDGLFRFAGGLWQPTLPGLTGTKTALAVLPDGDLLAAGNPAAQATPPFLARHDGTAWIPVAGDTDDVVHAIAVHADGDIAVAGNFRFAGGELSAGFAMLEPPCRATSTPAGAGCNTTAGPLALAADTQPWIGSAFTSTATGFAPNSFAIWELGTAPLNVALSAIHPAGGPGCTQWINPDVMTSILFPQNGALTVGVSLPNEPTLIGLVLWHQAAAIEVDPVTFAISHIASSDALALTFGAL